MVEMRMMRAVVALMLVAACSDADTTDDRSAEVPDAPATVAPSPEPVPSDQDVPVVSVELAEWRVTLSHDSIPAGIVSFEVRNGGTMTHRFEIEGAGQEWETANLEPGGNVTMSLSLAPGLYEVYCPVEVGESSHEDRGMKTVLRVY